MKALILAAGNGTRMQPVTNGEHKSLMPLLGLRIIERVILGAKKAGINEFIIVTGYKGKELKAFLNKGKKYDVSIIFIDNDDWEKANGISALLAEKSLNENFALLMSDHVFDPKTLIRLQRVKLSKNESVLAIDRNLDDVLDVDDTTKVNIKNNKIIAIHKKIKIFNAYDTGMFICSPYLFEVLNKSTSQDHNSLSDGMRILVTENKLKFMDIRGNFWSDCDTWEDIKFAKKKLLKSLTKEKDGYISKHFNRKISTSISKYLVNTKITPNQISFLILLLSIPTFFILAKGTYPWLIFGGIMIQFLSIIDGVDGEISRLNSKAALWGAWLDPILDRYVVIFVIAGMAYGYWNATGNIIILLVSILAMASELMLDYMPAKFEVISGKKLRAKDIAFSRDYRFLVLSIGTILNLILPTLIILIIISQVKSINRFMVAKKITERSAIS